MAGSTGRSTSSRRAGLRGQRLHARHGAFHVSAPLKAHLGGHARHQHRGKRPAVPQRDRPAKRHAPQTPVFEHPADSAGVNRS